MDRLIDLKVNGARVVDCCSK